MRRVLIGAGVLVMGFAVVGAVLDDVRLGGVVLLLGGVVVGHDLVLMPVVLGAGVMIGRFVPPPDRAAVRVAALCSLAVTVVALPLVLGFGRIPGDPSALPQAYGRGLLLVLAVLWASTVAVIAARRRRRARTVSNPKDPVDHDPPTDR
jgi:hypothetical protein